MHHNFGLSPFPLTARRPSSTNKRPAESNARKDVTSDQVATVVEPENITEPSGDDK